MFDKIRFKFHKGQENTVRGSSPRGQFESKSDAKRYVQEQVAPHVKRCHSCGKARIKGEVEVWLIKVTTVADADKLFGGNKTKKIGERWTYQGHIIAKCSKCGASHDQMIINNGI